MLPFVRAQATFEIRKVDLYNECTFSMCLLVELKLRKVVIRKREVN